MALHALVFRALVPAQTRSSCKPCNYSIWVVVKIMVAFLGTLNNRCRIIIRTQKGTLILTTTHMVQPITLNQGSFSWVLGFGISGLGAQGSDSVGCAAV